jgi:hypothetical protein
MIKSAINHSHRKVSISSLKRSQCHLPKALQYSGHRLRRGFATAASQKGASPGAIMRQGRWKHEGTKATLKKENVLRPMRQVLF